MFGFFLCLPLLGFPPVVTRVSSVNVCGVSVVPCPNMSPGMNFNMPPTSMGGGVGGGSHMNSGNNNSSANINSSNNKEPHLMPVPSPQQIQYLNQFEGQELTIQKQPNSQPSGPGGNPQQQQQQQQQPHMGGNNMMGMMDPNDVASQMW